MNPFTYPAWDLMTLAKLDTLPYTGVTFGEVQNQPGPWQGQFNNGDPKLWDSSTLPWTPRLDFVAAQREARTCLGVEEYQGPNEAPRLAWFGIIWTNRYNQAKTTTKIGANTIGSYFQQRLQAADYTNTWQDQPENNATIAGGSLSTVQLSSLTADPSFVGHVVAGLNVPTAGTTVTAVNVGANTITLSHPGTAGTALAITILFETDPMLVAKRVIEDAVAVTGGGILAGRLDVTLNPLGGSGQSVSVTYPGTQLQTIDSMVSTLAQMGYTYGYDYSFDAAYLPGTKVPNVTVNLWYPRQGRTAAQSKITVYSSQCTDWNYDKDGMQQANSVTETGSGTGAIQNVSATADDVLAQGYPLLEQMNSHTQISSQAVLINTTEGALGLSAWPIVTPNLILPIEILGSDGAISSLLRLRDFNLGDDLIFIVTPMGTDLNSSPRFPNGMSFEWRITNWNVTVSDSGVSYLVFDLSIPPAQTIPPPMPPQ